MTGVQHDGLPAQQADPDDFRSFPSLAKSLSAMSHSNSTGNGRSKSPRGSRAPSPLLRNGLDEEEHGFIKSLKDPQLFVDIPKVPRATEAALAALQYLPTPLLVLSSLKTIILANDAMGRLLGFDADDGVSQEEGAATKLDLLHGQSLSQIGIDVIEDGQSIWISWEKFLDNLADEFGSSKIQAEVDAESHSRRQEDEKSTLTAPVEGESPDNPDDGRGTRKIASSKIKSRSLVHDAVVNVIIASQHESSNVSSARSTRSTSSDAHIAAKMIISIWTMDHQRYFTLTFTASSRAALSPPRTHSRTASRLHSHNAMSPSSRSDASSPGSPGFCSSCGSISSPAVTSPTGQGFSVSPFPPLGAPAQSDLSSSPSVLKKLSRMKDAIINAMEIPVVVCWKDESLAVPNKAALKMMHTRADPMAHEAYDLISRFRVFTEDFNHELDPEEYPLIRLCRTQKPFSKWKIGMLDANGNQRVCECSGEGVHDEKSGEFLAGIVTLKDVTEYAEIIKTQSEQNEKQMQVVCETMPQMIWTTNPEGYHDWFSKRWYDYTGLSMEDSIGMGWKNPFHPDDMAETSKRWAHSLVTGDEYTTEYRCQRHDGAWRWMLGRALPLRDSKSGKILKWFGTCTDIQEVVEAREHAKTMRERFLNVIKHAQVTVWAVSKERKLVFLEGKLMWEQGERSEGDRGLGQNVYDVLDQCDAKGDIQVYRESLDRIMEGQGKEELIEHYVSTSKRYYRSRLIPLSGHEPHIPGTEAGPIDGVVCISVDITQTKRQEIALRSREEENIKLLTAETAAKEASRLKSQFLANMSHEIRTPIAGVIGMAELLMDTELDEEQQNCAENIQRSANGLLTVINDILDLSKVESGRLDIEEVQFSLSVVISDVSKMLAFAAERKNLSFKSEIQKDVENNLIVMGDPGRVRQILTNLLTNSIKFTSEGFVRLAVGVRDDSQETISVTFTVEDTGIGIEEEVRRKLFKPFSQADSSTARRFGGTGLGLTISKNLVDLMRGRISLESELGKGTKATFWIPFNKAQFTNRQSPLVDLGAIPDRLKSEMSVSGCTSDYVNGSVTPPISPSSESLNIKPGHRKQISGSLPVHSPPSGDGSDVERSIEDIDRKETHVLVVEDNAINQQIATKTIKKFGFSVSAVWNGKEALDYLMEAERSSHTMPDIILMDVQMPILDGYRATHLIRHHSPYSNITGIRTLPIVAMTASAIQGDREKCQKAGMDDYLAKPVRGKTLENMLLKWAIEGKKKSRSSNHLNAIHDDSSCTDQDSAPPSAKPDSTTAPSNASGEPTAAHSMAHTTLTGSSDEGDRSMRRAEAEEKAISLRDDKLFAASESNPSQNNMASSTPPNGPTVRPGPPTAALTEANVTKLDMEQSASLPHHGSQTYIAAVAGAGEASLQAADDTDEPRRSLGSLSIGSEGDSLAVNSRDDNSLPRSTVGSIHGPSSMLTPPIGLAGGTSRGYLSRHESDRSQATIKANDVKKP